MDLTVYIFNKCQISTFGSVYTHSFIHSFIHLLYSGSLLWCRDFKKVLSLQQSIKDMYSAPAVHTFWFFPCSLKTSLVFSIFWKSSPSWNHRASLKDEALWRGGLSVAWEVSWWQATLGSRSAPLWDHSCAPPPGSRLMTPSREWPRRRPHLRRSPRNIPLCLWSWVHGTCLGTK